MTVLIAEVMAWFSEPSRWHPANRNGIVFRTAEHLMVSTSALVLAVIVALPIAVALAHHRRAEALSSAVVNLGRAIPSFGLIVMFWLLAVRIGVGTQLWPLVAALTALALPPIFTNTYTAVHSVDEHAVESAHAMGMRPNQIIRDIELPLAAPLIAVGVRLAYVQVIATTAIGAIVTDGGGLGRFIVSGFAQGRRGWPAVVAGALLLGLLTIAVDRGLHRLEGRFVRSSQSRKSVTFADVAHGAAG